MGRGREEGRKGYSKEKETVKEPLEWVGASQAFLFSFFFFEFMGLFVRIGLVLKIDHVGFGFVLFPECRSRNSFP